VRLITVSAENFISIGPRITLNLRKRGLVCVEGENHDDPSTKSNGSGKTTVCLDTVSWCLWGVTTRGYEGDDVVNRHVGKNCLVRVHLSIRNQDVIVIRARSHDKYKHQLRLKIDGHDMTGASTKETQTAIERLSGMNAQTFLNSVMFGATPGYRFSALTDKQQKDVFDDALGMSQYTRAHAVAREELRNEQAAFDSLELIAANVRSSYHEVRRRLKTLIRKDKHHTNKQRQKLVHRKKKLAHEITKLKSQELSKNNVSSRIKKLDVQTAKLDTRRLALHGRISLFRTRLSVHQNKIKQQNRALARSAIKEESYTCEECGSVITAAMRQVHEDKLTQDRAATLDLIAKVELRINKLEQQETNIEKQIQVLSEEKNKFQKKYVNAKILLSKLEDKRDEWRRIIQEIRDLVDQVSPYCSLIDTAKLELRNFKKEISKTAQQLKKHKRAISKLEFWIEAFGPKGLRSYLIDTALPYLNERAAYYTQMLTDSAIDIEFRTQSKLKNGALAEKFEVAVRNNHGAATYRGNSGGEKAKVDLCVGLALQDLVMSRAVTRTNVAFFDEVFDKMDEAGVERAVNVLMEVAKERESVFVVTHLEALRDYFPTSITVVKQAKMSRLEE